MTKVHNHGLQYAAQGNPQIVGPDTRDICYAVQNRQRSRIDEQCTPPTPHYTSHCRPGDTGQR
ncbi:hypothetical protein DL347_27125 [Pseudomonas fluorescens]|uniref:Uncharacterized protein n=1 Tax=Pseudomonas fluorescens TaxID=294 RepID=A0A7Z6MSU6_PSEFL|nr:hypothetical protein DL347_27125 [Pseudomonas fluorescens]